jgi:peroxiredoxin
MVLTESTMLPLGTQAPGFSLPDTNGKNVSPADFAGKRGLLVMFICNHCPYVKHVRSELAQIGRDYADSDMGIVAICSNDPEVSPGDAPDLMREEAKTQGYVFPYLFDETQEVAKAYHAACTPDFFLFDGDQRLVYRGQFDGSRPGNDVAVTGRDLRAAADAVLAGQSVPSDQTPSVGCNIKWRTGNEPGYSGATANTGS